MKTFISILLCLILPFYLRAQWIEKEVGNNLFVKFPSQPEYKVSAGTGIYIAKTEYCSFMVIVQNNAIPNYFAETMNFSETKKQDYINKFLDGVVQGKLRVADNATNNQKAIKIGGNIGREVNYSAINPSTGERGKRFSKILFINNKLFFFECWFQNNSQDYYNEKEIYFKSIKYSKE